MEVMFMNTIRKIISLFLVLILTVSLLPQPVRAAQDKTIHVTYHYYNPLYYPEADQALYAAPKASLADPADISSAAAQLRSAIKARNENCQVQIRTNGYDEDGFRSLIHAIAAEAEVHTGVPTEGDYIMWQYGEWGSSATGSQTSGNVGWKLPSKH